MKTSQLSLLVGAALAGALTITSAYAQKTSAAGPPTPGFNTKIPPSIMTPDMVETRIGTLKFVDSVPTAETTQKLYDHLDFMRGVEAFLTFVPAASIEAMRRGYAEMGGTKSNQAVIFDNLMDSNPLFLTGNTDTVYCMGILDLEADGPTVVEVPPGSGPGTVNDAYFRFIVDMGFPGPDKGKGGKYLIVPAGYKGALPKTGYFIAHSPSSVNLLLLRGFLVDGKPDASSKMFRTGLKIYPLSKTANPPKMEFFNGSKVAFNTVHANDFEFFRELDHVIQKEPIGFIDPELRGLAAAIGIRKGKKFAPDARMQKILTEAVAVGNATARAVSFYDRNPKAPLYKNSRWETLFGGVDHNWLEDDGVGGRNLDARLKYFYVATLNTPAITAKLIDVGSKYAYATLDKAGNPLDGAKNYRVNVPKNVPAKNFWSFVVYDPQTRSELQTSQPYPSKNDKRDKMIVNADGSVDLYIGPKAPPGKEANWIATVPGKGWFALFRVYGPTEAWYDEKLWRVGEIELVN